MALFTGVTSYDGYVLKEGKVVFYKNSNIIDNTKSNSQIRVGFSRDKVFAWEDLCRRYHDSFEQLGWLRLHTPVYPYQEILGTDFLSVPLSHRRRILDITRGQPLVTIKPMDIFCTIKSRDKVTMAQLLSGEKLTDIVGMMENNRKLFMNGYTEKGSTIKVMSEEAWRQNNEALRQLADTKFYIFRMKVNLNCISSVEAK